MNTQELLLAAAKADNGGAAVVMLLICFGICWAMNMDNKPRNKTETFLGQKHTKYS